MRLDPQFDQIPDDSDASIQTQGLLGGKYVGIGPGGSDTYLAEGGRIELTQSALVLENLVNRLFASIVSNDEDESENEGDR
jgi:phospholipid/cholesterol/gamma-HCH transport system substrate-binding protein